MPVNSFDDYYLSWRPKKELLTKPYYLSLANLLEADIRSGVLSEGTELPPQRELADFLDVHFTTVTKAYNECKNRNLIYGVTGSGTFVAKHAVRPVTNSMDTALHQIRTPDAERPIEMGFVSSFEQTNRIVEEFLAQMLPGNLGICLDFANPTGQLRHREAGLRWMQRAGITADADHTAIATGSLNAVTICLFAMFSGGERIAVDQYVNTNFIELARLFHIQLVPVRSDSYGMIPESLERVCRKHAPKGIYLMPSCGNPTTARIPARRREALAEIIDRYGLIVLEDDHYAFSASGAVPPLRELLPERTLYICNTGISICSGLRVAFLVFPEAFRGSVYNSLCNVNVKASSLDTEVVCRLIESGLADKIAAEKMTRAQDAHRVFHEFFPENFCGHPYSFFRWLQIPQEIPGDAAERELLERGVHIYHSRRFVCGRDDGESFLRIALSSVESEEQLREGLRRIREYIQ